MQTRTVKVTAHTNLTPCPKCENKSVFNIHSTQVAEDGCEIWITCTCGLNPTKPNDRHESVMGTLDDDTCNGMIREWDDLIEKYKPVYVDQAIYPFGRMKMCHMMSEDLDNLHMMVDMIGVSRKHFQHSNKGLPHYDICKSKRDEALKLGAIELKSHRETKTVMDRITDNLKVKES